MADVTITVGPGKDYATLSAALTNYTPKTLTTNNGSGSAGRLFIDCYNMEDTTPASTGTSWTTSVDYYIHIRGASADMTSSNRGKWSTERYRLVVTATSGACLTISENYTHVSDLQLKFVSSGLTATSGCLSSANIGLVVERTIAVGELSGSSSTFVLRGFLDDIGTDVGSFINCLAYDFVFGTEAHVGFRSGYSTHTTNFFNCTAYNCRNGFSRNAGTVQATNCGAAACNTAFTALITQTNCSSSTPTFANEGGDDFHLASGDTTWKDAGDGSTVRATYTNDVDGQERPATDGDWDIGFDEYVSGAVAGSIVFTITL